MGKTAWPALLTWIVYNRPIEAGLDLLAAGRNATGHQEAAGGAQRAARHPAEGEKLALGATDAALIEASLDLLHLRQHKSVRVQWKQSPVVGRLGRASAQGGRGGRRPGGFQLQVATMDQLLLN